MAHFAEIDSDNRVIRVIVVGNKKLLDESGNESEANGIAFLHRMFGEDSRWVQCSYNATMRGHYPAAGETYDPDLDVFVDPPPFPSWTQIDPKTGHHVAPIERPAQLSDGAVDAVWDEQNQQWVEVFPPKLDAD